MGPRISEPTALADSCVHPRNAGWGSTWGGPRKLGPPQGRPSLLLSFSTARNGGAVAVSVGPARFARPPATKPPQPQSLRTVTRWRLAWRQGGSQARHPASQATRLSLQRP